MQEISEKVLALLDTTDSAAYFRDYDCGRARLSLSGSIFHFDSGVVWRRQFANHLTTTIKSPSAMFTVIETQ